MIINGVELENEEYIEIDKETAEKIFPHWNSEKEDRIYVYLIEERDCIQYAILEKDCDIQIQNIDIWDEELISDLER